LIVELNAIKISDNKNEFKSTEEFILLKILIIKLVVNLRY